MATARFNNQMNKKQKEQKDHKHAHGQYFTTNQKYILQNLSIPNNIVNLIEPFAGNADLLQFIEEENHEEKSKYTIECFDIEPKRDFIVKRDTIQNPPVYENKFIITNPPYLARNKSKDKQLFDKYDVNDLYKCFMKEILSNKAMGGIIIIPLNFWSSIRKADIELRKAFLDIYDIVHLNIFEEQVFDDTTTTVCSFQFSVKAPNKMTNNTIPISIYPTNVKISTILNDANNYMIGGEIYNLKTKNHYKISRLTSKNRSSRNTNILVKCIDDNENSKIGLSFVNDADLYIDETPNQSARTYCTLIIEPSITIETQQKIVEQFNTFLESNRTKYHSLFLTNYRESKDIARKRISFDLVYQIVEYILDGMVQ